MRDRRESFVNKRLVFTSKGSKYRTISFKPKHKSQAQIQKDKNDSLNLLGFRILTANAFIKLNAEHEQNPQNNDSDDTENPIEGAF